MPMEKEVNSSMFRDGDGMEVDVDYHDEFLNNLSNKELLEGENHDIELIISGQVYNAKFVNMRQRANKRRTLKLQIRYYNNSLFPSQLKVLFPASHQFLEAARKTATPKQQIHVPVEFRERMVVRPVEQDVFEIDCFPSQRSYLLTAQNSHQPCCFTEDDIKVIQSDLAKVTEQQIELLEGDIGFPCSKATSEILKRDREICEELKKEYGCRCQIGGENIGKKYGTDTVEVHHLIPFTRSLNSYRSNLIVISPNFHRIIHQAKPLFDRENLCFRFSNGEIVRIKEDKHLKTFVL